MPSVLAKGQKSWGLMIGGLRLSFLGFQPRMRRILGLTIAFLHVCVLRSRQGEEESTKGTRQRQRREPDILGRAQFRASHPGVSTQDPAESTLLRHATLSLSRRGLT